MVCPLDTIGSFIKAGSIAQLPTTYSALLFCVALTFKRGGKSCAFQLVTVKQNDRNMTILTVTCAIKKIFFLFCFCKFALESVCLVLNVDKRFNIKEFERGTCCGGHLAITYGGELLYSLDFFVAKPAK